MTKELLQQCLDALIESRDDVDLCYAGVKAALLSFRQERQLGFYEEQLVKHDAAIEGLKQALAQQEQPSNDVVTDEENERFSHDVSTFNGADPEATKYALAQFLKNRAKEQPAQEPLAVVPRTMILEDADLRFLHALSQPDDEDGSFSPIALTVGYGHAGHGLYASLSEYPEEGTDIICKFSAPAQPALSDDEFIAAMDSNGIGPVYLDVAFAIKELVEAHCRGGADK